jgi:hypothetical protein
LRIIGGNGTREQKEYRKNVETDFTVSANRVKVSRTSSEGTGGKYEALNSPPGQILGKKKKKKKKKNFMLFVPAYTRFLPRLLSCPVLLISEGAPCSRLHSILLLHLTSINCSQPPSHKFMKLYSEGI